ncbi:hypothetical protein QZQ41_25050, partial [Serratia marcescens]|nr:hypothetical protein [Serratia marcescens]MDP8657854.1 hypothetical protein [Serratia marcescens]MDP8662928.1 hypothetical protein [Serratia marcescens]MDP8722174.1 hypothetical protein [Serratia marcescens]
CASKITKVVNLHPPRTQRTGRLMAFFMENAMSQPEESGLERDYCAGQLSLREMAKIYGISEAAIRKRAKKHGWVSRMLSGARRRPVST